MTAMPVPAAGQRRYVALDGMRGIAAIAVALFHFIGDIVPHGYVAVDFFFVLSGFVLCRSYRPRWEAGLGLGRFMVQRAIRLYPLFLLGALLSAGGALLKLVFGGENIMSLGDIAISLLFSWGMLPSPTGMALFPLNVPSWSLFFEILVNFLMMALLFRLPRWVLVTSCLFWVAIFVPVMIERGSGNVGALRIEWGIALARTGFSFTVGMLIAMLPAPTLRRAGWGGTLAMLAIALLLGLGLDTDPQSIFDLGFILLASPLLVLLGSRFEPHAALVAPAMFLGEISYALYAVHWPFIQIFRYGQFYLGISPLGMTPFFLGFVVVLSWFAARRFDEPARRWLTARVPRLRRAPAGDRALGSGAGSGSPS